MSALQITTTAAVTPATFLEAAASGAVKFHTVRGSGTTRRVQFFAAGSDVRAQADSIRTQRDAGVPMGIIAAKMHVSIPSVRRMLNALLLAEAIEALDSDSVAALIADAKRDGGEPVETPEEREARESAERKEAARLEKNRKAREAYAAAQAAKKAQA